MQAIRLSVILSALLAASGVRAQLDTIHWIPPMHARSELGPQYVYLSTPESQAFDVNVRNGAGVLLYTVTVSNANPVRIDLGATAGTPLQVTQDQLQKPVQGKGLVIDGPQKFYAYFRAHSSSGFHACDLTCKGRAALGTVFRVGHLLQEIDDADRRGNFVGVMATEDSTAVTLSDFDPALDFRIGAQNIPSNGTPVTIVLQKGESAVWASYISFNYAQQPPNGLMGALLSATKPVAVNCGSWCGAPVVFTAHDIGIDQIAPLEKVGKEYILCKGNGSSVLEHPIVIAHFNNTKVWLNGSAAPSATLNAGGYYVVPTEAFSSDGNLYITASEPVFMYQMMGGTADGDDAMRTAGLVFVPPISCSIPNAVDNIFQPNRIGGMYFSGGLMLVAMKDSVVNVSLDGQPVSIGTPKPVPGAPDFVTYRKLDLFQLSGQYQTLSVRAQGAVQVAMFGRNEPASFAAFFSGFSKTVKPAIQMNLVGDGVCPDTLTATGLFDGVQWLLEDSVLQFGPDTFFVAYTPGQYKAVGYLGVCRRTDFATDSLEADFNSPEFPFVPQDASCFGLSDGQISIGTPSGGLAPYSYSIDGGQTFVAAPQFKSLEAGQYRLVVRDITGCYNRPLETEIGQPDSFGVSIAVVQIPDPVHVADPVALLAVPDRPVVATAWLPADSTGCLNCLGYTFRPLESTWVTVAVTDSAGCPATDKILILVEPNVYAPNVIKPGAEGFGNDRFTLYSRADLPIRRLQVYDRWGALLFEGREILTNHPETGWDGTARGKPVLPGVYVYLAEIEVSPGKVVRRYGDFTLLY